MSNKTQQIRIEEYDYPLPDERIAKFPLTDKFRRVYSSILLIICPQVRCWSITTHG